MACKISAPTWTWFVPNVETYEKSVLPLSTSPLVADSGAHLSAPSSSHVHGCPIPPSDYPWLPCAQQGPRGLALLAFRAASSPCRQPTSPAVHTQRRKHLLPPLCSSCSSSLRIVPLHSNRDGDVWVCSSHPCTCATAVATPSPTTLL